MCWDGTIRNLRTEGNGNGKQKNDRNFLKSVEIYLALVDKYDRIHRQRKNSDDLHDFGAVTCPTCCICLHHFRKSGTMKSLLLSVVLFVTMAGVAESATPEKIHAYAVPVFYTWVGGYTHFPQYPTQRPSYYIWKRSKARKPQPEKTIKLRDLPSYF